MRVNSYIYVFKFNLYRILRRVHRLNLRTVLRTDHAAVTVWGAALYAIRVVTANLLRDGTPATQTAAVRLAQTRVRRAAAEELWWVRNREAWTRDGGDDARRRSATLAEWARKWSGLLRLRHHTTCPEGYDLRPGTPLVSGWPKGQ